MFGKNNVKELLMKKCDICSKDIENVEMITVKASLIINATNNGYLPLNMPQAMNLMTQLGKSAREAWQLAVDQNSNSDWGVCENCNRELENYTDTQKDFEEETFSNKERTSQQDSIQQIRAFASALHKNLSNEDRGKIVLGAESELFESKWENLLKNLPTPLDLKGADFSHCSFIKANFENANLEKCNFSNCFINSTSFRGTNLKESCFDNSRIPNCYFDDANIKNASFKNVKFGIASFFNSDLSDCFFGDSEWHVSPPIFNENTETTTALFSNCKIFYNKKEELKFVKKYLTQEQLSQIIMEYSANKKQCFIATATYGNYNHPKVILFANFRDRILSKSAIGRHSIKIYYLTSPHFSKLISRFALLKKISKAVLDGIANRLTYPR